MSTTANTGTISAPATPVPGGSWRIDPVHSHVGFAIRHMVVATFRGHFEEYDGSLHADGAGAPALDGSVRVDSLAVKDENLAAHLRSADFFDSASHPLISFTSSAVAVGEDGELEVEGELTIKGRTRPVTARGSFSGPHADIAGNEKLGVELEAVIDRREFGLEWNAPLPKGGLALDNEVRLEVGLELVRES
jgi:polyisoprenoid-binding protein YceI